MYHTFYHLHTEPFRLTPDPAFCYRHERYARALAHMQYALWQGEGFIMVTGMPGTGKTTLIEQFHAELNSTRTLIAKLTSTQLQADELLRLICLSLGVVVEAHDKVSALHELRQFTIQHTKQGRRILLLIDEAQDLPEHALEELRLLGNLQLNGRPLLQIFLVGQQHLLDIVERPAMQPLYQRLVAACHLEPLNPDETRAYIEYRLRRAGWKGEPVFDERSYRMIHFFSEGFPRQINKVCSRLMLYGSTEGKHIIDGSDCLNVLRELLDELPNSTHESSFKACVDLLNESRSVPAESGNEVAAPVEAVPPPLAMQHPPSVADEHVRPQAAPEPEPVQTPHDAGRVSAKKSQAVSVPGIIERWDEVATRERSRLAAFMQSEEHTMDVAVDRQSAVPLTVERADPAKRRRQSMLWPELLRNQTARRVSAPLGLLVTLLTVLLLVSHGNDGVGSDELAAPSQAPEPQNTVARSVPDPLVTPPGAAPKQYPASPAGNIKVAVSASSQGHAEASVRDASQAAEPVVELPMLSGNNVAFAAFDDNLTGPNQPRGIQEALPEASEDQSVTPAAAPQQMPAETVTATASPVQSTHLAAAASAAPGGAVAVTQPETASVVGLHGSSTTVEQASAPALLAGLEVAAVTPPTEAQAVTDPQAIQASAKQLRINELMASAEQALREYRLSVPQGSSAWDYYRQVLQIEPQHNGADAGIQRIVNNYTRRTERALAAGQIDKARTSVTRGLMVSPGNRKLLALKQDVTARGSWLETQASLAAADAAAAAAEAEAAALRIQATPPPAPEQEKPAPRFLDKLKAIFSNRVPHEIP